MSSAMRSNGVGRRVIAERVVAVDWSATAARRGSGGRSGRGCGRQVRERLTVGASGWRVGGRGRRLASG